MKIWNGNMVTKKQTDLWQRSHSASKACAEIIFSSYMRSFYLQIIVITQQLELEM